VVNAITSALLFVGDLFSQKIGVDRLLVTWDDRVSLPMISLFYGCCVERNPCDLFPVIQPPSMIEPSTRTPPVGSRPLGFLIASINQEEKAHPSPAD